MPLTTPRMSIDGKKLICHAVVFEAKVTSDKEITAKQDKADPPSYSVFHRPYRTVWVMIAPYAIALAIAMIHFALHTYLHGKRVNIDTSFPQSGVSAISLVLVNTFRLAICFSLGVAFTQILSRRISVESMRLGDFDRLQHLQSDLKAWLHSSIHRVVPLLSIIAIFGWIVSVAMIFPSGSLTVEPKDFLTVSEQRVPNFNSTSAGNGTYASAFESLLGTQLGWRYVCTKRPVLATAKGALVSRDVAASISPCGPNCTFSTPFYGPAVKCETITLNETISIDTPKEGFYRPPVYSGGWSTALGRGAINTSLASRPGWTQIGNAADDHIDTFFVARHDISPQALLKTTGNLATYTRTTLLTTCTLHRSMYSLKTEYENGHRTLSVSTRIQETLESLWFTNNTDYNPHVAALEPINEPTRLQVTNLFALVDGLVQALAGEYYPNTVLSFYPSQTQAPMTSDPRIDYLRVRIKTIIADSAFNTASYDFSPRETFSDAFNLDLSEDRINEALQNITLSVMYTLNWWHTHANVSRTLTQNIFAFSSKPRLVVPYIASLMFAIPFLLLGLKAMRGIGEAVAEPGFIQALVTTAGSKGLRNVVGKGREEGDVRGARIRYGYVLGEEGGRKMLGLEGEVTGLEEKERRKSGG